VAVDGVLIGPEIPWHIEHVFETPEGRRLAVAEWGDPNGLPLISLHGTPGGRISYWHDPGIYARFGVRRITIDRPGYGHSTRKPGRSVSDIAPDVELIADRLGIDRFAVTGGSGGGPHALACAALLPDRVRRCLVNVSLAPYDAEGLDYLAGMTGGNVDEFNASLAGEAAIRKIAERERATMFERFDQGRTDILGDSYEVSESDQAQMARHFWQMANNMRAALEYGVDGWVDDDLAFVKPWGFDLASIVAPVYIQYGREDTLVPAQHGDWLAARLPVAVVKVDEVGHMGDDSTYETELGWLAQRD
jgi:pimeloyl-ACP methyl ester carboxylesterase